MKTAFLTSLLTTSLLSISLTAAAPAGAGEVDDAITANAPVAVGRRTVAAGASI